MNIQDFVKWLETLRAGLKPETARSFRIGKELYEPKFQYDIQSRYTANEIYQKAIEHKQFLHQEMTRLSKELWPKYFGNQPMPEGLVLVRKMIDTLSVIHVHRDSFEVAVRKQLPELVAFISQHNLLYIDPAKPLVVRQTPLYMRGVAGASVSSPGPYDKTANTYYNVTPLDEYTPEQAESYLKRISVNMYHR